MGTTRRKRVKAGDILEVKSSRGHSYVQYVGKHPKYGDVIRVLPGCFERAQQELTSLVEQPGYLAFYLAGLAVSQGLAEIVGSYPLPAGTEIPRRVRRAGARGTGGEVRTWIVEEEDHEFVRKQLTESERQLPIAAIWNHELLMIRISEGWHPMQEG